MFAITVITDSENFPNKMRGKWFKLTFRSRIPSQQNGQGNLIKILPGIVCDGH